MDSKNISGYDLALHVLSHKRGGGVEALLSLSGNDESCWLELKAGMTLLPEDEKRGEKPDDLYWNIAKAVISLMNTSGGIVLIGIDDKTHAAIPLQSNDPRHVIEKSGMETYRREEIFKKIWPDSKSWTYHKQTWKIEDPVPVNLIEVKGEKYRGEDIAVILVKPAPACVRIWKNGEVEQILVRAPGELGEGKSVIGSKKMEEYERNRHIEMEFLKSLFDKFNSEVESSSDAAEINRLITDYYAAFEADLKKRRHSNLSCFTPLDASGGEVEEGEDDFMSPQAVELVESDNWLDDEEETFYEEEDDNESENDDDEDLTIYREKRSGDLLTLMREIPRMSLLGDPGGGKTTTLIHFTLQFSRETSDKPVLAVFIPMGQWRNGGSISSLLSKITGLSAGQWSSLICEQRLRLVIDAVNECPDQFRKAAVLDIKNFLQVYSEIPVTISARTDEDLKTLHLPTFTVNPMDEAHQRGYLVRYLNDEARADEIMARLKSLSGGAEIAANPMLLRLVVEVVRDGEEIPAGRSALYRKWLRQWYSRESGKHRSAGSPLPWAADETLEIFSVLAFKSRLQGYRDVPIETATEILQQYGKECVDKLCQGPVVTADEDFIHFRHETFQEYLCAEYLIRQPNDLPTMTAQDYAQWGMPVAYASELCGELPEALLLAAWRMNPWFGYALNADGRVDKSAVIPLVPDHNRSLFECLLNEDWKLDIPVGAKWYSHKDRNLAYLIATDSNVLSHWRRMELWRISKAKVKIYNCLNVTLALKTFDKPMSWDETQNVISSLAEDEEVQSRILENWRWQKPKRILHAIKLVENGFAVKEDFTNIIPRWIRSATPLEAKRLVDIHFATKDDFIGKRSQWIQDATLTPEKVKALVGFGWVTEEDFANSISRWIQNASPLMAKKLIDAGMAAKEDFADRISTWIESANPKIAKTLIDAGMATKEDFSDKIIRWLEDSSVDNVNMMLKARLVTIKDVAYKILLWRLKGWQLPTTLKKIPKDLLFSYVSKDQARQLMRKGLATGYDFPGMFKYYTEMLQNESERKKISLEFTDKYWDMEVEDKKTTDHICFSHQDFSRFIFLDLNSYKGQRPRQGEIWSVKLCVIFSKKLDKFVFAVKDCFLKGSIERDNSCADLAITGDFVDKNPQYIQNRNSQIATETEIERHFRVSCKDNVSPTVEASCENNDNTEMEEKSECSADVASGEAPGMTLDKACCEIELGMAVKEDFTTSIPGWIKAANATMAQRMITCGLATIEDFKGRFTELEDTEVMKQEPSTETERKYANSMLIDDAAVSKYGAELAGKKWYMEVCQSTLAFSFFKHSAFPDNVFCYNPNLKTVPEVGSTWAVEVGVSFDEKRQRHGFVVTAAELIAAASPPTSQEEPGASSAVITPEDRKKYAEIGLTLQKMCGASKENDFLKRRPESWDKISFAFCRSHKEVFINITGLLQSLGNSANKSSGAIKNKLDELARVVHSCPEFESILPNMHVPPPLPPPKPTVAPKPAVTKKAASATKKIAAPKKLKIVHGLDYDPKIDFGDGIDMKFGVTDFSRGSSHIRIYIDEAWPGTLGEEYNNIGVISGIVWDGAAKDYDILPKVPTHLRENDTPREFRTALNRLFHCPRAFPFIFPITEQHVEEKDYPALLRIALYTLLGWILPQDGVDCDVSVFCEGIGTANMEPAKNYADSLNEVRNFLAASSGRMRRWCIREFVSLETTQKEFEYVPYADALGYLTIPTQKARSWGKPFKVKELGGYVPLSGKLFQQLKDFDSDSPAGLADMLFTFAGTYRRTKLFFYILEQIVQRAQGDPEFRNALFEKMEKMFEDKQRDVQLLGDLCGELSKRFRVEYFDRQPRQKLIRLLVELHSANHSGTPEAAEECVRHYRQQRDALIEDNRELCAYTDMNLAVHYNDQFDFNAAAAICRPWESDPAFEYFSRGSRGTILSSIGQGYAFAGDCERAYKYFVRALKLFSGPPVLEEEVDQTAVYCALNLLDYRRFPEALKVAESVFKCGFAKAIDRYADNTNKEYHHHLLVKNLFFNPEAAEHIPTYLDHRSAWQIKSQHPWELIELYRILLLHNAYPEAAKERTAALWKRYAEIDGSVFKILEAFARCVIFANCGDADCVRGIPDLLSPIKTKLPFAAAICQKLRCAAAGQLSAEEIWQVLPFNYK